MKFVEISCELCDASNTITLFVGGDLLHGVAGEFPVVRCQNCGLVYVNPRPEAGCMGVFYPSSYSPFYSGKGIVSKLKKILRSRFARRIAQHLPAGASILEVGSASGDLMVPLRALGSSVTGIEMSPYAVSLARKAGFEVHQGTLEDVPFPNQSFDAVVMRHVIEHVPSPTDSLYRVHDLLAPDGLLFITTPNCNSLECCFFGRFWHAYDPPRHLTLFTVKTLTKMLDQCGFSVISIQHESIPNNWIYSTRNFLVERYGRSRLWNFFSLANPLCLALFAPLGLLQSLLRNSGVINVIAIRKP